jgi:hypothetical protein
MEKEDGLLASHIPIGNVGKKIHLFSTEEKLEYDRLETWGHSKHWKKWADDHGIAYCIPPWEVVREVNSKEFSWKESPKLPNSALLKNTEEVEKWMRSFEGLKVLKSCFGVSGRGHLHLPSPRLTEFLQKEFSMALPVIGEPWLQRDLDFSTQWFIHPNQTIDFLGSTLCISNAKGKYVENRVGKIEIPFLDKHCSVAQTLLQKMARKGFFGNIGIDAMIYEGGNLHPVVEINARKTMGWVALQIQRKHFAKQTISVSYVPGLSKDNVLPQSILRDGSAMQFSRQLLVLLDN